MDPGSTISSLEKEQRQRRRRRRADGEGDGGSSGGKDRDMEAGAAMASPTRRVVTPPSSPVQSPGSSPSRRAMNKAGSPNDEASEEFQGATMSSSSPPASTPPRQKKGKTGSKGVVSAPQQASSTNVSRALAKQSRSPISARRAPFEGCAGGKVGPPSLRKSEAGSPKCYKCAEAGK